MKNLLIAVTLLAVTAFSGAVYAKGLEIQKSSDDMQVKVQFDKESPSVGDNNLSIEVKNTSGTVVTDAPMRVEYSMPAMPGMPAMNYKTNAETDGGVYKAKVNLSMSGPWNFTVKVKMGDKISSVKFNVDAR